MRALQLFAPPSRRAEYQQAVDRARAWLTTARANATEERAFRLLGLSWASAPPGAIDEAVRQLLAAQRPDGGWAQDAAMPSDAYANRWGTGRDARKRCGAGRRPGVPQRHRVPARAPNTKMARGTSRRTPCRSSPISRRFPAMARTSGSGLPVSRHRSAWRPKESGNFRPHDLEDDDPHRLGTN